MACGRIYGRADVAGLLQSEGISPEAIQALLGNASVPEFHGTRSMLSFKDVHGRAPEHSFFRHMDIDESGTDDLDDCFHQPEKKRRLTLNQVQFLEKSFEVENKLEPDRKIQLARDLGLQPRQVAIWFQNRRARWKTKQLERDYETLKLSYDNLKGDHDNLTKEKEKLKAEVQVLKDKLVQKEGEKTKINMSNKQFQELDSDLGSEEKKPELRIFTCKHEDICSADSVVLDCDSPRCTAEGRYSARVELADSTNQFELDNSDNSNAEDDEEEKASGLAKLGDNTCGFSFPVEEPHALWSWPF